jgi:hypothetical protein
MKFEATIARAISNRERRGKNLLKTREKADGLLEQRARCDPSSDQNGVFA